MLPYFPWLSAVDIRSTKFSWWWHIITFDFITKRLAGDATSLFTSLMVSTTRGLEFTIAYISIRKVFSDSSSKLVLCVFRIDESIARADFICLSHLSYGLPKEGSSSTVSSQHFVSAGIL